MDIGHGQTHQDEIATLLARCALADSEAFRRLYERVNSRLYAVALAITKDPALAADALHDALLQIYQHAGRYRSEIGSGWTWVVSIVRYRALDAVARAGREVPGVEITEVPDNQDDPLEPIATASEIRQMFRCMARLEDHPRRLVKMAYLGGMTHAELAVHVGHPLGSTKSVIRRALMRLRDCMGGRR